MKKSNEKGVSIVTVIVTIVILVLIVGAVIGILIKSGAINFDKAQDNNNLNVNNEGNVVAESIDSSLPYLKVGDYVDYKIDEQSLSQETIDMLNKNTGYKGNEYDAEYTEEYPINQEDLNWRVLDYKDGHIRLISDRPTTSLIYLEGYNGYNNGVYLINKICDELYSSDKGVSKGLAIEDLEEHLNFDYKNASSINEDKYGSKVAINTAQYMFYPSIYAREIGSNFDNTSLNLSEQDEVVEQDTTNESDNLEVTITSWTRDLEKDDFRNSIYYDLFVNKSRNKSGDNSYYLASRSVFTYDSNLGTFANFGLTTIGESVSTNTIYDSRNFENIGNAIAFRPIITLNSDIVIEPCQGENSADNMHTIK